MDYTRIFPENPLPFGVVNEQCGICKEAMEALNRFISDSRTDDKVRIDLQKDSTGRGWHIVGYNLPFHEYVDLTNVGDSQDE